MGRSDRSLTESVIILNTSAAVKAFSGKGQIKFGGNLSLAAGPVGRDAEASVNAGDGGVAACYSYSHTKGLFAGVSLQGVILFEREKDNKTFYGVKVSSKDILQGSVTAPHSRDLDKLYAALGKYCGNKPLSKRVSKKDVDTNWASAPAADFSYADPALAAAASDIGPTAYAEAPASSAGNDLPKGWKAVYTADGETYYWNESTNETAWEKPKAGGASAPPPPPRPGA